MIERDYWDDPPDAGGPCNNCGAEGWQDWLLLPHATFNSVCPGGEGFLCFPCFAKRTVELDEARETHAVGSREPRAAERALTERPVD